MQRLLSALFLLLASLPAQAGEPPITPPAEIRTGGNPATLVLWGDAAPLVVRTDGAVFAAASQLGAGRIVALGHGGYLDADHEPTRRFLADAIDWLHNEQGMRRFAGLTNDQFVRLAGANAAIGKNTITDIDLTAATVVIGSPQAWKAAGRLDELRAFIESGGGLLATECAWGQIQLGRAESINDLAANVLLRDAGIAYTDRAEASNNTHDAARAPLAQFDRAWRAIERSEGDVEFAARVAAETIRALPRSMLATRHMMDKLATVEARRAILDTYSTMGNAPLTYASAPLANVMLAYEARLAQEQIGQVYAHPTHRVFPGETGALTPAQPRSIEIDTSRPGWHSTGLWVPAGETALVAGDPRDDQAAGLGLQIGSWLDPQDFDGKVRFPLAMTESTIASTNAGSVSTYIGGPLYIVVPADFAGAGVIDLRIGGAIPMPRFVLGATTLDEWNAMRTKPAAPWAELESDNLVFTLPMDRVAACERPDLVMEHWDRVHQAMHELNPRSPNHWPDGQYRFVAEKRLSWGYMYCPQNAPAVIPMTAADEMVDLAQFDAEGPHQLWGHYHEMGHAHQSDAWTFDGTVEVTVNIFTVFALHTVNGYPLDSEHLRSSPEVAWQRFQEHKAAGAPFDTWKRDPFLGLQTYSMLWHEFGFKAYKEAFARYRDGRVPMPRTEAEKRDTWVRTISQVVQRDLSGYFDAWGVPISQSVRDDLAGLEPWMPTAPE